VHTLGMFLSGAAYDEARALSSACRAWQRRFQYAFSEPPRYLDPEQIELLADLLYQPFRLGPRSQAVVTMARHLLAEAHACGMHGWQNGVETIRAFLKQVSRLFDDLTEIANRDLFYTVQPYLWECREELLALTHYLDWLATNPASDAPFPHHDRLPNTYRQGLAAALQQLLPRDSNGRYHHDPGLLSPAPGHT
jgi:hypothetical protein